MGRRAYHRENFGKEKRMAVTTVRNINILNKKDIEDSWIEMVRCNVQRAKKKIKRIYEEGIHTRVSTIRECQKP